MNNLNIPKSFIMFLIASTSIWLVLNLSKTYYQKIPFEVEYTHLPQNKFYQKEALKTIDVEVKATGFNLFIANFSQEKLKLSLANLQRKSDGKYFVLTKNKSAEIQTQLPSGLKFQRVTKDTLHFNLGTVATKKVPLVPELSINYELGFDVTKVTVTPDSVLLSGTDIQLSKINEVVLERLTLDNISEDVTENVAIIPLKGKEKLKMSHDVAQVTIEVGKFTEGEFEVPVFVKNIPPNNITIFPKKVKVIFKVGLDDFNKVTADSFEIEADYQYTKENKLSYLLPKLKMKSDVVSSVRIVPEKIDFLINN